MIKMPWIDRNRCTGCGLCVDNCPAEAISIAGNLAVLDMENCIRCGSCHEICPTKSIHHDSELTDGEVEANLQEAIQHAQSCADLKGNTLESLASLERHIKHYKRQKLVAEKTLERLQQILAFQSKEYREKTASE
jgi:formate hydrogenlyase subunit 6/NADH:ubiquinone oxidoreductase subunit I